MNTEISSIQQAIQSNNYQEAETLAWSLYKKNSNNFTVLKTLGLTLLLQQKYIGSIDMYLKCLQHNSEDFDVLCNLAFTYLKLEEFSKAYQFATKAASLKDSNYLPFSQVAEILMKKRDFDNSVKYCDLTLKMIDLKTLNQNIGIVHVYVDSLIAQGKRKNAVDFIRYYQDKSFNDEIFQHHATISPDTITDEDLSKVKKFLDQKNHQNHIHRAKHNAPFLFGLAKYFESKNELDKSEEYFYKGNEEILKIQRYFPLSHQKQISKIKKLFLTGFYENNLTNSNLGQGLIFIVGMPRSGTSLLESILGISKNTISGGELLSMHYLSGKYYLESSEDLSLLQEYKDISPGEIYENRIKFIRGDNSFFIDKLPGNYHNIGFIKCFLPKAKIVYIKRDPWDIAISIFKQFYVDNIPYAASFFNIAINIANHFELIRFWEQDMGFDFLTISYEDLVANTQEVSNKVFQYCEIDGAYDEELRKKFFSRTASKNQISKDIHTASISKNAFDGSREKFYEFLENQEKFWKKQSN